MWQERKKHVYENGLTLVVDEAPQLMSVAIAAWVKTGSRHENLDSAGICHFLEHMLFKGSKKRGALDIAKAIDRVGGDFNAFTSREHTCFHFYLPAKELSLGAVLLKEILFSPLFEKKEIERERQVIIQEIAMVKETPEEEAYDRFLEKCFGKHPLGRQILGTKKSVSSFDAKKLFQFFYQHYCPENMVISVSGAVSFATVKRLFAPLGQGMWPNRKKDDGLVARWGMDPPTQIDSGCWWIVSKTEQVHLLLAFPAPVQNSRERLASIILQQYLGGGMSSILFDEIREKKGWAYTIYANAIHFLDSSMFAIYAGIQPERINDVLLIFRRELQKVAKNGIATKDLSRIKESLLCSFELSMESSESRVMSISQAELYFKKAMSFKEYKKVVCAVKSSEIQELVAKWLKGIQYSVQVLGKKPKMKKELAALEKTALLLTKGEIQFEKE